MWPVARAPKALDQFALACRPVRSDEARMQQYHVAVAELGCKRFVCLLGSPHGVADDRNAAPTIKGLAKCRRQHFEIVVNGCDVDGGAPAVGSHGDDSL